MKIPGFIGGEDIQNSLNLANNQCINLYPTTNDDGSIAAFYKTDGLKTEATLEGIPTGAYKTSTGRAFYVTGTTLYELSTALVSTSRGTLTAGNYTFSDNGIELICVNGTDGWLFTLATNVLTRIKVSSGTCFVYYGTSTQISKSAHGFVAGDRILLSTAGALPTGISVQTIYYVLAGGLTENVFYVSETAGGLPVATTSSGYGVHTLISAGYGFPEGCKTVSYLNGRFVACEQNTQNFFVSEVLDGGYWDQLNVQTADSNPDYVVTQVVSHNELIVFCENSGEVYFDSGTIPSPFTRNASGIFEVGCVSPYSIAKLDNSIFWLGRSDEGGGIVYRLNGYTPTRVSTFGIENAIQAMSDISDAKAWSYQKNGHHFFVLTFPTGRKTFVFDANSNLWHERASFINGVMDRWEADFYLNFSGKQLVTDYFGTSLYSIDKDTRDNGANKNRVVRSFRTPIASVNKRPSLSRYIHHLLQIHAEVGVGVLGGTEPVLMLRWSDDGGHSWSKIRTKSLGAIGEYAKIIKFQQLGMTKGQPRIYEVSCTDSIKLVLIGAYLE